LTNEAVDSTPIQGASATNEPWLFNLDTGNANFGQHPHLWQYTIGDPEIARNLGMLAQKPTRIPSDPKLIRASISIPDNCLPIPAYVPADISMSSSVTEISGKIVALDDEIVGRLSALGSPIAELLFSAFYRPDRGLRPIAIEIDGIKGVRSTKHQAGSDDLGLGKTVTLMVEMFFEDGHSEEPISFNDNTIIDVFVPAVKNIIHIPPQVGLPDRWLGRIYGFEGPIYVYKVGRLHVSISPEGPICVFTSAQLGKDYSNSFAILRDFVLRLCEEFPKHVGFTGKHVRPCFTYMSDQWQPTFGRLLAGSALENVRRRKQQLSSIVHEVNNTLTPVTKVRVLYLAANADTDERLALDEEIRDIRDKIRGAPFEQSIEIDQRWAVRPDDILLAMNQFDPTVVHFSGHANIDVIAVKGEDGSSRSISKEALVTLFQTVGNAQVVILNGCFTDTNAEAITQYVPCAIGMTNTISDDAAIAFAGSFYRALAYGRSIQQAFDQARTSIMLQGIPEQDVPRLHARSGIDLSNMILTG